MFRFYEIAEDFLPKIYIFLAENDTRMAQIDAPMTLQMQIVLCKFLL